MLKHGLTEIDTLWAWHQDVAAGKIERRNGTIFLLDDLRLPVMWWNFAQAYPVKWSGPQLAANSTTIAYETVELVHQGISKSAKSRALSAAHAAGRGLAQLI